MFTGIIETTGTVESILVAGSNKTFWISSAISDELKVDQSVSHSGVCLTVEALKPGMHQLTAIDETLQKTTLGEWKAGDKVNIERCMQLNGRLDGHIVQGHVDSTATCTQVLEKAGSWEYSFDINPLFAGLIIEKGSISLNGVSLTIFNVRKNGFTVAIIPYTYHHTNLHQLRVNDAVNIEFDMIGKYVHRIQQLAGS